MKRLTEAPNVHDIATVIDCTLGKWTEVMARVTMRALTLGDDVWIGQVVTLLAGVAGGTGAVIGAGAVV